MQKIINKKVYDTENSEVVSKKTYGAFGSKDGYEETIYKNPEGFYFLYTNGGADSKYPKESIKCLSKVKAMALKEEHNS